jgi:predicted Zn-dependent protease with MMP-like domain
MMQHLFQPKFTSEAFNQLVVEALDGLPAELIQYFDNVEVVVSDLPTHAQLQSVGLTGPYSLLGLYEGIPLTRRTRGYNMVLPDKITIFRLPIERICSTSEAVIEQVRHTVVHELAHHFGISDERLKELGAY